MAEGAHDTAAYRVHRMLIRWVGQLTHDEEAAVRELLDEHTELVRLRATQPPLTDEYGLRITYVSTRTEEGAIADTLAGALEVLAEFDAKGRDDVVSRELRVRKVGQWREASE